MIFFSDNTDQNLMPFLDSKMHNITLKPPRSIGVLTAVQWYDNIVRAFEDIRSTVQAALFF